MTYADLVRQLKRHEGFRSHPYKDSVGILTIGYGRNLEHVGISEEEAQLLLSNDLDTASTELEKVVPYCFDLPKPVRYALVNLCFNIGITRLMGFKRMLAYLDARNYDKAADELLDSKYARQVGKRAIELADQIRSCK